MKLYKFSTETAFNPIDELIQSVFSFGEPPVITSEYIYRPENNDFQCTKNIVILNKITITLVIDNEGVTVSTQELEIKYGTRDYGFRFQKLTDIYGGISSLIRKIDNFIAELNYIMRCTGSYLKGNITELEYDYSLKSLNDTYEYGLIFLLSGLTDENDKTLYEILKKYK